MWKVLKWLGYAAMLVLLAVLGLLLVPLAMAVLWLIVFAVLIPIDEAFGGLSGSEAAIEALKSANLSAYTAHAPSHSMTVDDSMTIFELSRYDNHVNNTDLRAGLLALAATTEGWRVGLLLPEDYAVRIPLEAAFLLPDATFDAWFESTEDLAFFDRESGLFIRLHRGETPKPGSVTAGKLTVPHNGFVYEMETHGGFHGDGTTFYALIVPEDQRPALEKAIADHADWHMGNVTHAEYRVMHDELFFQVLPLYPAADVDFEWCSFVDTNARMHPEDASPTAPDSRFPAAMQDIGACWSMNWRCALYDPDTGLFIYYEHDT